jgi:hypothetical protein
MGQVALPQMRKYGATRGALDGHAGRRRYARPSGATLDPAGILALIVAEVGLIHPPVGLNVL